MNYSLPLLLIATVGILFTSCQKQDPPPAPTPTLPNCSNGYRLEERREITGYVRTFEYNGLGRLARYTEAGGGASSAVRYYEYSFDQKPEKIRIYGVENGLEILQREQTIHYSVVRAPITLTDRQLSTNEVVLHKFKTDTLGRITSDSIFNNSMQLTAVLQLEWEGNNLSKETKVYPIPGSVSFTFDNKVNPNYELRHCFLDNIGNGAPTLWSANNVKDFSVTNNGITQKYDLNLVYYNEDLVQGDYSGFYLYECR
jgi:hypothetical protein